MSKEFQIRDGNLIASFDLENEDGDIDFCKLLKVSHGVADEIGMFVDYVATNKIIKDKSKQIADLEAKLAKSEEQLNSAQVGEEFALKCCDEANNLLSLQVANHYQDKISFAVEQIMQVREKIDNSEKIGIGLTLDGIYEIDNIFDKKIAELTHQHEDKGE